MLTDSNYMYCGEHSVMYIIVESLSYTGNQYNILYKNNNDVDSVLVTNS